MKRRLRAVTPKPVTSVKIMTPEAYSEAGTEHAHQVAVFMWVQQTGIKQYPELARLFAIPNGGLRHAAIANRLKMEGVKAGVPDLFLPVPRGGYSGLFIEMKRPGQLKATSDKQDEWLGYLQQHYQTAICDNWRHAVTELLAYMVQPDVNAFLTVSETDFIRG